MKKLGLLLLAVILISTLFVSGFQSKGALEPNTVYEVYLDDEVIGRVKSKDSLEEYIDQKGKAYKKKLHADRVYAPNGLEIKKVITYDEKVDRVADIYQKISEKKPFTIKGYRLTIQNGKKKTRLYIDKKSVAKEALENTVKTFVGIEEYESYMEDTQAPVTTTGSYIDNIYINNNMTMSESYIPVTEKIYTDSKELSQYLLFGKNNNKKNYTVQVGDTISQVAFNNQISVNEFLISNPEFTSEKSLLFPGQTVVIGMTDPQIQVVSVVNQTSDVVNNYSTEERYDSSKLVGEDEVIQEGEDGLDRVKQELTYVNGDVISTEIQSREELKPSIKKIVVKGDKVIPSVGYGAWYWPVPSHYVISPMGYRVDPISGARSLHTGADIAESCGKPIWAANNGVVTEAAYRPDLGNGNYVTINHNNGYYTLYAHMSKYIVRVGQVVEKGQLIGYVGRTGRATGCHLHFEAWRNGAPRRGQVYNALLLY